MLSYWFPTPVSFWWPLALAAVFAIAAVVVAYVTMARRAEEQDAGSISLLYALGLGLVAVSEFVMYLDVAFGWSLASAWALSADVVNFFAVAVAVVAVAAIGIAGALQFQEERSYRLTHQAH